VEDSPEKSAATRSRPRKRTRDGLVAWRQSHSHHTRLPPPLLLLLLEFLQQQPTCMGGAVQQHGLQAPPGQ
jgi:hypothetical protein